MKLNRTLFIVLALLLANSAVFGQLRVPACDEGDELYQKGEFALAIKAFSTCLEFDKFNGFNYYNRGMAYLQLDINGRAIVDLEKAIELDEKFMPSYYALAEHYMDKGEEEKAINWMNRAIRIYPLLAYNFNLRGWIHFQFHNYPAAYKSFDKAIQLDSTYASAYNNRGSATYLSQNIADAHRNDLLAAKQDYLTALFFDPDLSEVYRNLGYIHIYLNELDTALYYLAIAAKRNPNDPMVPYYKGLVYKREGKISKALEGYNRAISIYNRLAGAYFERAEIYVRRRNWEEAKFNYQKALDFGRDTEKGRCYYGFALISAIKKKEGEMFKQLEKARKEGYFDSRINTLAFKKDSFFDSFRGKKEYKEFVKSILY